MTEFQPESERDANGRQPAGNPLRVVQISDPHMVEAGKLLRKKIDSRAKTHRAITTALELSPDVLVFSGDIAQRGHNVYAEFAELVAKLQKETGVPVISIGGNHDVVGAINHTHSSPRVGHGPHPANGVYECHGVRFIALDTGGVGKHHGELDDAQLDWLREVLESPAPQGSVVVMHHAPIEATVPAQKGSGLADPLRLAKVISGTDVRVILAGHYHHPVAGALAGVPVWAAPAVGYNFNQTAPPTQLQGTDTAFINLITMHPTPTGQVSITPVDCHEPSSTFTKNVKLSHN